MNSGLAILDAGDKKFNSRPVVPTVFRNEPFCRDDSCITKIVFKWRGAKG